MSASQSKWHLLKFMRALPHARVMTALPTVLEHFGSAAGMSPVPGCSPWLEALQRLENEVVSRQDERAIGTRRSDA
jgi:hypothetical protein